MMIDYSDSVRAVQNAETEATALMRQLHLWLALGSAGGAVSMFSFATAAEDPDHALRFFQPSLWFFLLGVVAAGAAVLFRSLKLGNCAEHTAAAANREGFQEAVRGIPEIIASPESLAERQNAQRNKLIELGDGQHAAAEGAWKNCCRYDRAWKGALGVAAISFVLGFGSPLIQVAWLGGHLRPLAEAVER